jgi:hypothetical protein
MQAVLKQSRSGLPDQVVEFTVDRKLRTVHLRVATFDPHAVGYFVIEELPRRARGVIAHSVAARTAGQDSVPYSLVVAFAGIEFPSKVVKLAGEAVDVILFAPPRSGADAKRVQKRSDLVDAAAAARMAGVRVSQLLAWVRAKRPRVIGFDPGSGELAFPRWQFDPLIWPVVPQLAKALDGDAATVVTWLETPLGAFEGLSPRQALERGESPGRVLAVAEAEE